MARVFFHPFSGSVSPSEAGSAARKVFETLVEDERTRFESKVPLKVHFGEKGNQTYIPAGCFDGIIDSLQERGLESCFIETNVLYMGQRSNRTNHLKTAAEHGFIRLPVEIADGEIGQDFHEVKIEGRHFKSCMIAAGMARYPQMIFVAHFKGHTLSGFGGAMKQLAMGCASRGGKLAQHQSVKPFILPLFCRKCGACRKVCPAGAIRIGKWWARIDPKKCIGCAGCIGICPFHAIHTNYFLFLLARDFTEKLAEYAFAAQLGKHNIYLNFIMNVTSGCDCLGMKMATITPDVGILASTDPVAVDKASLDLLDEHAGRMVFPRGREILDFGERLGMGKRAFDLVKV